MFRTIFCQGIDSFFSFCNLFRLDGRGKEMSRQTDRLIGHLYASAVSYKGFCILYSSRKCTDEMARSNCCIYLVFTTDNCQLNLFISTYLDTTRFLPLLFPNQIDNPFFDIFLTSFFPQWFNQSK